MPTEANAIREVSFISEASSCQSSIPQATWNVGACMANSHLHIMHFEKIPCINWKHSILFSSWIHILTLMWLSGFQISHVPFWQFRVCTFAHNAKNGIKYRQEGMNTLERMKAVFADDTKCAGRDKRKCTTSFLEGFHMCNCYRLSSVFNLHM